MNVDWCSLSCACCFVFVYCCLIVCRLLFVVSCVWLVVRRSVFVVLVPVVCSSLLAVC